MRVGKKNKTRSVGLSCRKKVRWVSAGATRGMQISTRVIVLINTKDKKRDIVFSARYSGGPKRPTSPTHGAAGGNLRDMQEMVHDLDISTTSHTPRKPPPAELERPDLMLRSDLLTGKK